MGRNLNSKLPKLIIIIQIKQTNSKLPLQKNSKTPFQTSPASIYTYIHTINKNKKKRERYKDSLKRENMSEVKASEKEKLLMGAERSRLFGGKDKAGLKRFPGKRASLPAQFYIDYSQPPEQDKQLLKETQKMKAELFAGK